MKSKWLVRLVLAVFIATAAAPVSAGQGDSNSIFRCLLGWKKPSTPA